MSFQNTDTDVVEDFDPFAEATLECVIPTSEAQREVWLADKLSPQASLAYNESVSLVLSGALDGKALQQALDALVARHQSLRATVSPDGTEMLVSQASPVDLRMVDVSNLEPETQGQRLALGATAEVEDGFDLEQGPLFRATLYQLAPTQHVLQMTAHHIVCDGWSWGVITEDLGALYAEALGEAPAPGAAQQYGEYVAWELAESRGHAMAEHEAFWLSRFQGSLPVLDLPTDRPRPGQRSFASLRIDHGLDASLIQAVRVMGARSGASVFATLYAAFAALIGRIAGQDDVVIGVPSAGQSASGMHSLVGHCVNLLPVRTALEPSQPFSEFLQRCSSELLDAFDHQTLTYGSLLKKLPIHRDPSRLPLVSIMFNVDQAVTSQPETYPGLAVQLQGNPRRSENFELFVNAAPVEGGYRLECQYNTELFEAESVERWLASYEALLRSAVAQPQATLASLSSLSARDWAALQALQPLPSDYARDDRMHSAFERQAAMAGERVALRCGEESLSYSDLDGRANRLARALRARGVHRGARVGLCLTRSSDMLVALLAVLKAGATYVPLDPSFPSARLSYYAEDAGLALLVTQSSVDNAPTQWRTDAAQRILVMDRDTEWQTQDPAALAPSVLDAQAEDAAYIIYTSGSTGKPKGVAVPHRAVVNFLQSMAHEPGLKESDVLAAVTTLSFDIAVLELMLPLSVGAQVLLVSRDTAMDGALLGNVLDQSGATCLQATPAMWRLLLDSEWRAVGHFKALVGGEALPADLARAMAASCTEVWNMYGPTETTVWSTVWKVDLAQLTERGVSIGRPIANTTAWILNEEGALCPVGVPGELCIGGEGVTLGYVDRADLTADRFIADRYSRDATRALYRTGDRARWRNDGQLEHLGRLDFQVKVRGYRIELGEIEAVCAEANGVTQAVVLAREDIPGDVRLVAYLKLDGGAVLDEPALRGHLRTRLPDYMVPQHWVTLANIPLLPNGKIDRKALPTPAQDALPGRTVSRVSPRTETEKLVAAAMEDILRLPGLGCDSDFFQLGGHSLLAARLTTRLNKALGLNLPLRTVFEFSTVAGLAHAVEGAQASRKPAREPIVHQADQSVGPLTVMQERIRFMEQLYPGRVVYNTPSAHRLTGPLDVALFEQALRDLVRHQPALRTYISERDDRPVQVVLDEIEIDLPQDDLSAWPVDDRDAELQRRVQAIVDQPIDIHHAPLFRVALFRLSAREHVFLFIPHHMVWDGWSFDVFYENMAALYEAACRGVAPTLTPLALTYVDFAHWHAAWMDSAECQTQVAYWRQRYSGIDSTRALVTDHPRTAGMTGVGAVAWVNVDAVLTERLRKVAVGAGATLNMLLMGVYAALMSEALGHPSVVIGVPMRGRLSDGTESVMGFFNNMLPIPVQLAPELSIAAWTASVKRELLDAFAHQEVPFERLMEEPEIAALSNQSGLYQTLFSFQDARERQVRWGALSHERVTVMQKGATEDFGLWLVDVPSGLTGGINYNADLFDRATAELFRARLLGLLCRIAASPELTVAGLLADEGEDRQSVAAWLGTRAERSAAGTAKSALPVASSPARASLTAGEAQLGEIWAALLGMPIEQMAASDNFFDLGGNSLQVMQAASQAEQRFGLSVDPRRYVHETLGQLSVPVPRATFEARTQSVAAEPPTGLLSRMLGRFGRR